jgi:outer membrane protein assembly factor BamC
MRNTMKAPHARRHASSLLILLAAAVAGCSSVSELLEPEKIDYKSAAKAGKGTRLEVPPDLSAPQGDSRYAVTNTRGTATASEYSAKRPATAPAGTQTAQATQSTQTTQAAQEGSVAPAANADAGLRVERDGKQRWLVARQAPEALWPRIREFWQQNGFTLAVENPDAGVMETAWAENRAKIPQDFIRSSIGKVFESLYSTSERDKFRTRLERTPEGGTEIYISHRGAEEKLTGQSMSQSTVWTGRPSDPELEAEFLGRLMASLGTDPKAAKAAVKEAPQEPQRARVAKEGDARMVEVDEGFDRAWRRVGLALDRVGFTVEDRDRARGLYFVRYIDQEGDAKNKAPGFFSRLFSSKDDKRQAMRYQIQVKGTGERSRVSVLDERGAAASDATAGRILSLLGEQLR